MEFQVLGPVDVRAAGRRIDLGHAMQRAVLAVLLFDLNHVVPADLVIDRVWGERPPGSVRNMLYGYVGRLRAALAGTGDTDAALTRRAGGYQLEASENQVDLHRFRGQVSAAKAAPGDDERASLLRGAVSLWRGTALAGLDSPWLRAMRNTLESQRMEAVLELNEIALRHGQHQALISDLTEQAANYPADERIAGQLMLALYRSGHQAEALRWFDRTRWRLSEEFGADPGIQLTELHQRILRGDPGLAAPASGAEPGSVPRELPADVSSFTGRAFEVAELDRRLKLSPVCAVSGTYGVGKTALAVHWAHRSAGRFPDGQLYLNLRGYDQAAPLAVADALAALLRSLGLTGKDVPADQDERAARYRSLLAGRRMLVLLDNASNASQVRPLLPGTAGCVAVVTSRDSLAGLVARDGATRLALGPLPPADALDLLRALIGERVRADDQAARVLADRCSRLPLALRIAAELAAARPEEPLSFLAAELAGAKAGRLDLLDAGGEERTAVRAVFSWSGRQLDAGSGAWRYHP